MHEHEVDGETSVAGGYLGEFWDQEGVARDVDSGTWVRNPDGEREKGCRGKRKGEKVTGSRCEKRVQRTWRRE